MAIKDFRRVALAAAFIWGLALPHAALAQSGAVLGGSRNSFDQEFGGPNDHSSDGLSHYRRCPNSNVDQMILVVLKGSAITVTRQPCGTPPASAANLAEARAFMPSDSAAGDVFLSENGEPAQQFFSPSLSSVVDAEWFRDCAGETVAPGTFSLVLTIDGGWGLAVGTCP